MELAKERTEIRERKYRETNGERRRERERWKQKAQKREGEMTRERENDIGVYL